MLLTARFLRLLGMVDHPQQILAMTFTRKAAGEMQERVAGFLLRANRGEASEDELDAQLIEDARRALDRHRNLQDVLTGGGFLHIQTFHSFCFNLVSRNPLEAGVPPGTTLLDEEDQLFLLREAIDQTLTRISEHSPDDVPRRALENRLLHLNNSWPLLAKEMEDLMLRRDALGELVQVLNRQEAADTLLKGIQELIESELVALKASFECTRLGGAWGDFIAQMSTHGAASTSNLSDTIPGSLWGNLAQWQVLAEAFLTKAGEPRKQFGPKTGYYSGFSKTVWAGLIQDLDDVCRERLHRIREFPDPDSTSPDVDVLWDLVLLVHAVMEVFQERCRAKRVMDFLELEIAALRLLENVSSSDLPLLLDQQIRHLLVDEFQDTSYQQWILLQRLCSGWAPGGGRSLFVVGDPKQSIYGFRKAEVRLFLEARKGLPLDAFRSLPLEPIVLRTNFRSRPHLIAWCNALFERTVMADPKEERDEVPFTSSIAAPGAAAQGASAVPELALFCEWPNGPAARRREANWLAGHIHHHLKDQGAGFKAGILLFVRTHLSTYLEALQNWGVPVQVTEGLRLIERPEVKYLWQLCRALVLPHDHLAWAAQLHSPWLMLSYDDLYAVSREAPQAWVEKIRIFAEKDERIAEFWEALREARQHLGHEPLGDVVESAWLSLGGARQTGEIWGSRGLNSCRRFLDLIREAEVYEPVQTLQRLELIAENAYEPPDPGAAASRVCLMTVHRAKGLEFDTVYLPHLDWKPLAREAGERPPYLLERSPGSSDRYLLAARPDRRTGERDPIYEWLRNLRLDRRYGEAKRLFYVALTRARSRLCLSAALPWQRKDFGPNFPSRTPLSWLNDHYGLDDALNLAEIVRPEETRGAFASEKAKAGKVAPVLDSDVCLGFEKTWQCPDGDFHVLLEPPAKDFDPTEKTPVEGPMPVFNPRPFEREKPLFRVRYPSSLGQSMDEPDFAFQIPDLEEMEDAGYPEAPGALEEAEVCRLRLRGIVIHRLLEAYGRKRELPPPAAVSSFLKYRGMAEGDAIETARSALSEVAGCLEDTWLRGFYDLAEEDLLVEFALECVHSPGVIYAGVVDLAAFRDGKWVLLDYKTSRPLPEEDLEIFMQREVKRYTPQLCAYREMWAKARQVDESSIEAIVYWTALKKWLVVNSTKC